MLNFSQPGSRSLLLSLSLALCGRRRAISHRGCCRCLLPLRDFRRRGRRFLASAAPHSYARAASEILQLLTLAHAQLVTAALSTCRCCLILL